jgi:carbon-monoxide dehydrogenase medium subunit
VALGAVNVTPILVPEAAAALIGSAVDDAAIARMGAACSAAAKPITDKRGTKEYRIKVSGVMARRAAVIARDRAKGAK